MIKAKVHRPKGVTKLPDQFVEVTDADITLNAWEASAVRRLKEVYEDKDTALEIITCRLATKEEVDKRGLV